MGRFRVSLLEYVTKPFDRKKAEENIVRRLGFNLEPARMNALLTAMEASHNREAFLAAISKRRDNGNVRD